MHDSQSHGQVTKPASQSTRKEPSPAIDLDAAYTALVKGYRRIVAEEIAQKRAQRPIKEVHDE